ncbi:MAG: NUDIX domain-containing protein [Planctomycetota bacterium]|jgi:DNA repair photolyase
MSQVEFYTAEEYGGHVRHLDGKRLEFVVSAYLVRDNKVSLIQHKDLNMWLPPGGHLRPSEDPTTAVLREIREETGWSSEIVRSDRLYYEPGRVWQLALPRYVQCELIAEPHSAPHVHVNLAYFCRATVEGGPIDPTEGAAEWFSMHDLDTLDRLFPHTRMNAVAAIREIGSVVPERLVLEKDRFLVPIGGRCPFECAYCYTKRHDIYFGEPNPQRTFELVERLYREVGPGFTAQLGYDNDPFIDPRLGLDILSRLVWLPVHLGFSTKAKISAETAGRLSFIRKLKMAEGYNLSGLVTITCMESSSRLEPRAPTPGARLETVARLAEAGIPVLINLRPVLPGEVQQNELKGVIERAREYGALGVVLGAFWSDPEGIVSSGLEVSMSSTQTKMSWAPHGVAWLRYEDEAITKMLLSYAQQCGLEAFESSADAVRFLNARCD